MSNQMKKSTKNTVFVKFVPTPPTTGVRHQLEDIFSATGPIRKASWMPKGYGFVKYVDDDGVAAATKLNKTKIMMFGKQYLLKVEPASVHQQAESSTPHPQTNETVNNDVDSTEDGTSTNLSLNKDDDNAELKKKSRIILRNVSFYANEQNIRKSMEKAFGAVSDVHLPRVQSNLHVGFCFVTFVRPEDAKKAVETKAVIIKKRSASINWSIPKHVHQQQQNQRRVESLSHSQNEEKEASASAADDENTGKENSEEDSDDEDDDDDDDSQDGDGVSSSSSSSSQEEPESANDESSSGGDERGEEDLKDDLSIQQKRVLFLRNLPFDITRHDLFQFLSKFGHIQSIYLVHDKNTGMLKGTAFVTFAKAQSAERVVQKASATASSFVSQRESTTDTGYGPDKSSTDVPSLVLNGRKVLVDFAVDKETATTFDTRQNNIPSADRRNMYLQASARVESSSSESGAKNANTWDDLPVSDQKKRQAALKDKTTKLQSPIFFINPKRLSIRNLAKHVDEASLQKLCKDATIRGLQKNLVGGKDQIAHWRALGDMSTRDILSKIQEYEESGEDIIPPWDPKSNIKEYLPSVYIDRDFGPNGTKTNASSRGYGFAEFQHHVHALACLKELNNNPFYSSEFVAGGKIASEVKKKSKKGNGGGAFVGDDGRVRVPRLIVDFVVENKVKAKKQAERRLHQKMNMVKQRSESDSQAKSKKKRSRGSAQREQKRQKRNEEEVIVAGRGGGGGNKRAEKGIRATGKRDSGKSKTDLQKVSKPAKKKRPVDDEEKRFDARVTKHQHQVTANKNQSTDRKGAIEKRWFD